LTYFSILEGIEKIELLMLFFMPIVISIAFYISYFLFPARWLTRIPFVAIYAVSNLCRAFMFEQFLRWSGEESSTLSGSLFY
jgi:hypothetical protein